LLVNHGAQLGQRRLVLEKTILYALGKSKFGHRVGELIEFLESTRFNVK